MSKYRCILTIGAVCVVVFCHELAIQKAYALEESTAQDGSNAQAVHALGETGEDVNVGLISAENTRITHEAFKDTNGVSHAFYYDATDEDLYEPDSHDTWVAGVVASRGGVSHPDDIGVAPGVDLHSAKVTRKKSSTDPNRVISFGWMADALDSLVNDRDCRVIVTGIAFGPDLSPNGQSQWTLLYDYYAYTHNVIFANPSGKDYTSPTVFGDSYNGITTGGLVVTDPDIYLKVGTNSNSGPTLDGRQKPDLAAPSQNQTMPHGTSDTGWHEWIFPDGATSLSTPHTAGVAALLLGLADDTANPDDNQNEVIKAVIVNSTFPNILDKLGNPTIPAGPNNPWNKDRGYGRIDALRAYQLLDSNEVSTGAGITEKKGWAFNTIGHGQQHVYTIYAPKRHRLVTTLTWSRRVEWIDNRRTGIIGKIDEGELHPYLADLDLRIYEPNNTNAIFSKQTDGFDPNDNLIKCDILLTHSGWYTLKVMNNSTDETAYYGFAFELPPPLPADFDLDYIVDYNDILKIAENWLQEAPGSDADLFQDDFIDFMDFALLAENWLTSDPAYHQD
ncbi:MAG: S8 family serine peptidase [Phycisphaerae bacterium]|nr:S8 family serine peptidase [Phycisphaerae bacterium]MDD5381444.1 S8 family serine peptidase [Phycisphaerae bacterium]